MVKSGAGLNHLRRENTSTLAFRVLKSFYLRSPFFEIGKITEYQKFITEKK